MPDTPDDVCLLCREPVPAGASAVSLTLNLVCGPFGTAQRTRKAHRSCWQLLNGRDVPAVSIAGDDVAAPQPPGVG